MPGVYAYSLWLMTEADWLLFSSGGLWSA